LSAKSDAGNGYAPSTADAAGGHSTQKSTGVSGASARGPAIAAGAGQGGNARGGVGDVQGAGPGNGLNGNAKTGAGGNRVASNGGGPVGGGPATATAAAVNHAATDSVGPASTKAHKVQLTDEEEPTSSTVITQVSAQVLSRPEFDLPDSLRRQKFDGHVEVRVIIEDSGRHTEEMVKSSGSNDVDHAVLDWLRSWHWKPATQDSKPVRTVRIQKINLGVN
jgi:TonB family protein